MTTSIDLGYRPGTSSVDSFTPDANTTNFGTYTDAVGDTYYYFLNKNNEVLLFDTAESRSQFIQNMSLRLGYDSAGDISSMDGMRVLGGREGVKRYNGSIGVGTGFVTYVSSATVDGLVDEVNNDFFGGADAIPTFPSGVRSKLDNIQLVGDYGQPNSRDAATVAGIRGAALDIYGHNDHLSGWTNLVDRAGLDDDVELLAQNIFNINSDQITQGHINTLRLMGLTAGNVDDGGVRAVQLSTAGRQLLNELGGNQPVNASSYVTSSGTRFDLLSASAIRNRFDQNGALREGESRRNVSIAAKDAVISAGSSAARTSSATSSQAALELADHIYHVPTHERMTDVQINTLIAAGLLTFDRSNNRLDVTDSGRAINRTP